MSKRKKFMIGLIAIIALVAIYQYPVQRHLALTKFQGYINEQDVEVDNILKKEAFKDWKNGGYVIVVSFKDDVGNKYYYHYFPWTHQKGEELKFNRMLLSIVDEKNSVELYAPYEGKCKYPPIEE